MGFLYVVKDLDSVDVWVNGQDIDARIVLERGSFITFLCVCQRLGVSCIEVLDCELVVD